jgi:hypothetical protein
MDKIQLRRACRWHGFQKRGTQAAETRHLELTHN